MFAKASKRPLTRLARSCSQVDLSPLKRGEVKTSNLLHLSEFEFNRRCAAEDRDCDLHARAAFVDFFHGTVERRERAVGHAHLLADLERDRGLGPVDAFL